MTHSYHLFYFPFKWTIKGLETKLLSEQINLDNICYCTSSPWERMCRPVSDSECQVLYNEKNYYYKFVHNILYDEAENSLELIRHFERKEPKVTEVCYLIKVKGYDKPYRLAVDAINLNLYATGVGVMSFFLRNEDEQQSSPQDILAINQYGRRILPPFYADIVNRNETSEYISIEGLCTSRMYKEDFQKYKGADSWKPASFLTDLMFDLSDNLEIEPVIDDRMFVACCYKNNTLADEFIKNATAYNDSDNTFSSFWYKFLYVDCGDETCQNVEMKKRLLGDKHTYLRWQKEGSLYGVTRYSFVYLTNERVPLHLLTSFQTIYARMIELVLLQRASMLRFSDEVTKVSHLSHEKVDVISNRISSLYKEYIRFMNRIYFREVTAQDQGIEFYSMLQSCLNMEEYVKDLDGEIGELHEYVSLREDRSRNEKATLLNDIATLLLPITVITGFFGMNRVKDVLSPDAGIMLQGILLFIGTLCAMCVIYNRKKRL